MEKEFDIFISYPYQERVYKEEWAKNLIHFLKMSFLRLFEYSPKILDSYELGNYSDKASAISSARTFLIILPENYKRLTKFSEELELLSEIIIDSSDQIDVFPNVFKILKSEIPRINQPEFLRKYFSYEFFERYSTIDQMDLEEIDIYEMEQHYWMKLTDLVHDLYFFLNKKEQKFHHESSHTFYLAASSDDQMKNVDSIKRELRQLGHKVLPNYELPDQSANLIDFVKRNLKLSDFSIHFIGEQYGHVLDDGSIGIVEFQNQIVTEFFNDIMFSGVKPEKKLLRIIWLPPDLRAADERQKIYIDKVLREAVSMMHTEVIQTPIEKFKTLLNNRIELSIAQNQIVSRNGKIVYLIHEGIIDKEIKGVIESFSLRNVSFVSSVLENDSYNHLFLHKENLVNCDGVIICLIDNNLEWFKSKLKDIQKAFGFGRLKSFDMKLVLINAGNENMDLINTVENIDIVQKNELKDKLEYYLKITLS